MRVATRVVVCLVVGMIGCGPTARNNGDDTPCTDGEVRCDGNTVEATQIAVEDILKSWELSFK